MSLFQHVTIELARLRRQAIRRILAHRIQYRNPSLISDDTAVWNYGYNDIDAIELGKNISVGAYSEIVVYKYNRFSSKEGRLVIGDNSVISTGVNIRAAGGPIRIGCFSVVAQNSVLVAANHKIEPGKTYIFNPWDESRIGVEIGDNVWVGAGCVLVPGASVGDNSVIGAGSVVTGEVPANEIWAGVPARKIRALGAPTTLSAVGQPKA